MPDRVGQGLVSGGDIELGVLIGKAGYRRAYVPSLRLVHEIPRRRIRNRIFAQVDRGHRAQRIDDPEKYDGAKFGPHDQVIAAAQLCKAICAIPWLMKLGGWRETTMVMADRWARLKGPIRSGFLDRSLIRFGSQNGDSRTSIATVAAGRRLLSQFDYVALIPLASSRSALSYGSRTICATTH